MNLEDISKEIEDRSSSIEVNSEQAKKSRCHHFVKFLSKKFQKRDHQSPFKKWNRKKCWKGWKRHNFEAERATFFIINQGDFTNENDAEVAIDQSRDFLT